MYSFHVGRDGRWYKLAECGYGVSGAEADERGGEPSLRVDSVQLATSGRSRPSGSVPYNLRPAPDAGDLAARREQHRAKQRGIVGEVGLDQQTRAGSTGIHPVNCRVAVSSGGGRYARDTRPAPATMPRAAPRSDACRRPGLPASGRRLAPAASPSAKATFHPTTPT